MLKEILSSTHWTQERLAAKLGVSFATVNYWLNGKTKPQKNAMRDIERLYVAQDVTGEDEPVYITLVKVPSCLKIGDYIFLEKDKGSIFDDESIRATIYNENNPLDISLDSSIYVANSVLTVARGTRSAGRIYDKFDKKARAQVMFILQNIAIARIINWEG